MQQLRMCTGSLVKATLMGKLTCHVFDAVKIIADMGELLREGTCCEGCGLMRHLRS